ncbi:MAG: tryptophan-rich sensory protein [Candidatus Aenigmarchaeota archaeon]|nr:tryptophan-rich sensory protein [Candidatus Aenigmarchaeota archaeon]
MNKWIKLFMFIFLCQMAGIIGSVFTTSSITTWYATLEKPWFTPPNFVFGPVWITLYTLMGISLYLVWDKKDKLSISFFSAQLLINTLWSILFFGLKSPLYGLISIIPMWILILLTIVKFYMIDKRAGVILIPYIVWVTIATLLNYFVWVLN